MAPELGCVEDGRASSSRIRFAGVLGEGVLRSTDAGLTWQIVNGSVMNTLIAAATAQRIVLSVSEEIDAGDDDNPIDLFDEVGVLRGLLLFGRSSSG